MGVIFCYILTRRFYVQLTFNFSYTKDRLF